ncbi:RNA polymerase sigma-70 factor [Pedobacter sp. R-06]|uniref:RNA polymerase sigma-70 factor n=1 Tax=Pedobacter sp. R-06 TaxID=3404051 RepID=UPI003CF623D7
MNKNTNYTETTDADLLNLLRENPEVGITMVYNRYWKVLLDAAFKRLKDEQEAKEVVQELFIALYTRRNELVLTSGLEAYLGNALKYRVLNHFRHQTTRERYAQIISTQSQTYIAEVDQRIEDAELAIRLKSATEKLPPKCREVFLLSKIERVTNAKIAEKLGISVSTVEKHISRGMILMRKHLGDNDSYLTIIAILLFASSNK